MRPVGRGSKLLYLLVGSLFLIGTATINLDFVYRFTSSDLAPGATTMPQRFGVGVQSVAWADKRQQGDDIELSIVIDDFDDLDLEEFPKSWKAWRGDDELAREIYTIKEEEENRYLQAIDDGSSIIIRKRLRMWDANEYPILSWRWRARILPEAGDESVGSKNDSSVAVYVVLDQNFIGVPKTLKYVWSTTLPVGTYHRRDGIGRPHVIVLESGKEKLGQWVEESVDVYTDYVRIFGDNPPQKAVGIGVLTDGNATGTDSQGDYDDFVVHRRDIYPVTR